MLSYSKAPRGLFVLVELGRVFTAIAISPSECLRQLLARDAIRAGRNFDLSTRFRGESDYIIILSLTLEAHFFYTSSFPLHSSNKPYQ